MTKARRIVISGGGGIAALVVAGLLGGLDGLDQRPYFKAPYYAKTCEELQNQTLQTNQAQGELQAGFGRALLTPTLNAPAADASKGLFHHLPLAGYGQRQGKPAQGVHDDVLVKAAALRVGDQVCVMVSADALIIPREVAALAAAQLRQELKLRREQIYFGATHTHASLGGWGEGLVAEQFAGAYQPEARIWFADRLVAAVRAAVSDLRPASAGHGRVVMPEFVRNRLVGNLGRVDPDLSFTVVQQTDGQTAVLGAYAAHATVLSGSNMEFSGDYPGCWQRAIEQATGGLAMFFAGGVGSHSPVPGTNGFAGVERMGQALAQAVLAELPKTQLTNRVTLGVSGLELRMPELHTRVTDGLRLRPWLARHLFPAGDRAYLQVYRLDNMYWVSTPCDFSGELALGIKEWFRGCGRKLDVAVTSFNGDYIGYVIPHRYYHLGGYEPQLMSFFGPNVPDYLDELIRRMLTQLSRDQS